MDELERVKAEILREQEALAEMIMPGILRDVECLMQSPDMQAALLRRQAAAELAEEARSRDVKQKAEQAAREELARVAEFNSAKAEALERLGVGEAEAPREWANLTEIEQAIVVALNDLRAYSNRKGIAKSSGEVLAKMDLNGVGHYQQEVVREAMTSDIMRGIVGYDGEKRGRRYWLINSSLIPQ